MRIYLFILTAVFLIFNLFSNASEIHKKGIIIPAYFYDGQIWDRLINGKKYADLIITSVNDYQDDNSCYVQFPEKDGCILYNASYGEMKEKILNENVRFIYLTDYNDFDDLPSYLEEEIDIIKR